MEFDVLGPWELRVDGRQVRIGSRMQRRLLALLLVEAEAWVRPERVIDVLWAGTPPPSAPQGLHTYVSRLRGALGAGAQVESDVHGYRLRLAGHRLDASAFEHLVSVAQQRLTDRPEEAAAILGDALALWRGPAYAEFAAEDFARPEAVRLDELRLVASEDRCGARLACGDTAVIADLDAFTAANPLRERPHLQLMTALGRAGRHREALEVFHEFRARLRDETGLDPSPALQQVQAEILQQASGVTAAASGNGGQGRLESLPGNLPVPVTSFVGRHQETDTVRRLLERHRLVTLTGVGGVGKTRLALQAAAAAGDRPDGVWWCELAPADPGAVGHTVAAALGIQQQADRTIAESIVDALAGKRLLLALDNCEHVVEATAHLAQHLLRRCGGVTILATSRQPLAVDGERIWVVPPLPLPGDQRDHGEGVQDPSTQLFGDRAVAHRPGFTPDDTAAVASICRQLDGLPLAIELAAALVPALEPAEIARRLGDRFRLLTHGPRSDPRHRSLTAVVEWSYLLLEPLEQRLFDRLAVFAGGSTLDAIEGICTDDELPAERIAGLLTCLVTRSMVTVDRSVTPARYHLLETMRHYARERLADRDEDPTLRARHATWFVELAEAADRDIRGPLEADAVMRLEADTANLRAAHRFALERDDADLALRLSVALYVFALHRLRDEVFAWAEAASELPSAVGHPLRPTVWGVVANGMSNRGELARGRELADRALATAAEGDEVDLFPARHTAGATALYEGRLDDCLAHTRESVAPADRDRVAYEPTIARMHEALALIYGEQREEGTAATLAARTAADDLGNPHLQAWSRYVHAEACGDDDPAQALELLEEALVLAEPVHARFVEGVARHAIAALRSRHDGPHQALPSFRDVIGHWRRAGDWTHQWTTLRNLIPLLVRVDADEPAALLQGAQRTADTAAPAYGADADRLARTRRTLIDRLGTTTFATLDAKGGQLSGHDAVDLALATIDDILDADPGPDV